MNVSLLSEKLKSHEKFIQYACVNRSYLIMEAVFSDETENFVKPFDPDPGEEVTLRLRTARNDVEQAFLHVCDKKSEIKIEMKLCGNADNLFDYWQAECKAGENLLRYYYSVHKNGLVFYYNKKGLYESADPTYHFRLIPGFHVPEWARGAVMYQIFVDRFYNGDPKNDVVNHEYIYLGKTSKAIPWKNDVVPDDVCNFYGGDLRGVMDKMDYLKDLGVEVIYLNPIFVSPSNHKYDIQDYDYVDPHYGVIVNDGGEALRFEKLNNRHATKYISRTTDRVNLEASNALFSEFISLAHENGIKVILDGVFNHCGSYNKWLDKAGFYAAAGGYEPGAYRDKNSPYKNYFLWFDENWPNNDCYDGWWGNENHPKLNFEDSQTLCDYILQVAQKWVSPPYCADGWRLDVAADLGRSPAFNHLFWQKFREAVKTANKDAIILAEIYGDVSPWLSGGEWDTVMNYDAFMEPITWFLTGVNKHSESAKPDLKCNTMVFENAMRFHMSQFCVHSLQTSMNELSNHDHSRFLTRTNGATGRLHIMGPRAAERNINKNVMLEALVFQMTWPGAPTVYYGDEAGLCGWTDPDNRRPFPWGSEDALLMEAHKVLIALRKEHPVLRGGSLEFLWNDFGFLSYGRWDDHEKIAVFLNNNPKPKDVFLPVWKIGCHKGQMKRLAAVYDHAVHTGPVWYDVADGIVTLTAPGQSAFILGWEKSK